MEKLSIKTFEDLTKIKQSFEQKQLNYKHKIVVCSGAGCISSNCKVVKDELISVLEKINMKDSVKVVETGCIGTCDIGPVIIVYPQGVLYSNLSPADISHIITSELLESKTIVEKTYFDKKTCKHVPQIKDIEFFTRQTKIALKNCGSIDFASLEEYISNDGYFAASKVLNDYTPAQVVDEMKKSGLRGRGGGGFPTGLKWEAGLKAVGDQKYIICNADEGDPGAFMDRSVLEGDPHCVIEGMLIGGYAIGATKGVVYVRAEYPIAVERLQMAIDNAYDAGLLGKNILGKGFDFDLDIRIGAGAFVCGEETSLMASVEGQRGEPRQKPPFPFQSGLYGKPTIINNVETFASVPSILLKGSNWFASYGTEKSKGTKVFALAGDINNTGIVEVPMGVTLGEIIFDIGAGIPKNKKFKAAQTGGPSGGCITPKFLNTPVDYESLSKLGAIMGSGGLICMDDDTCMVDMAKFFMEFVQEESCGKCIPCRIGTKRMLEILERITCGKGREGDIELLIELGTNIKETALCGLGQTAPNPILSTIQNFREEYEEHIYGKHCRAGVCSDLFIAPCSNACPAGVNVPGYVALIANGQIRDAYNLIRKDNPFPAICGRVCTHPCESKCRRATLDEPLAIASLKRYAADYAMNNDVPYMDLLFPKTGKKVAIIGAGPSGLTCAYYLARLGHEVDVFEKHNVSGGVLAFGIPEYRLPTEVLNKEIKNIVQAGVKIHLEKEIGKDVDFAKLRKDHNAVYIATGAQMSKKIGIPGENFKGVLHGLDFLRDVHLGKPVTIGKNVVVVGGGNTAIDASRVALRLGAQKVTILYRREVLDMPADRLEILEAMEEGIEIIPLVSPTKIIGNNCVEKIECIRMSLNDFDENSRRKPVEIAGSEFLLETDTVIAAVSQYSDMPFISRDELEISNWGTFINNSETMMTRVSGVFAGGDLARGIDTVITAIADGKNAARAIDMYLGGKGVLNTGNEIKIPVPNEDEEVSEHNRFETRHRDPNARKNTFEEVSLGFDRLNAIAEAMRCLRCDRRA